MPLRLTLTRKNKLALQAELEKARTHRQFSVEKRCLAILLTETALTFESICDCLMISTRTLSRWLHLYLNKGTRSLKPRASTGRPPKLTKTQRKDLYLQILEGPEAFGYASGVWTSALIQAHIKQRFRVNYSVFYIPQLLRNMGIRHIKPKAYYAVDYQRAKGFSTIDSGQK